MTPRALVPADLPIATTSALGAVQPDGSSITISAGVISVAGLIAGGAGGAMTLISSQTLATAAATITFSSIPATYTHLMIVGQTAASSSADNGAYIQFNADAGAHYDYVQAQFSPSTTSGFAGGQLSGQTSINLGGVPGTGEAAGSNAGFQIIIPNYAGTAFNKRANTSWTTTVKVSGTANPVVVMLGGQWYSTAAITSVTLGLQVAGNLIAGTTISLYGMQ
jgi:hypothetical protein